MSAAIQLQFGVMCRYCVDSVMCQVSPTQEEKAALHLEVALGEAKGVEDAACTHTPIINTCQHTRICSIVKYSHKKPYGVCFRASPG